MAVGYVDNIFIVRYKNIWYSHWGSNRSALIFRGSPNTEETSEIRLHERNRRNVGTTVMRIFTATCMIQWARIELRLPANPLFKPNGYISARKRSSTRKL